MGESKSAKERRKGKSYEPQHYETVQGARNSKKYARVYALMIESEAFKSLTSNQKVLYLYMKLEDYSGDRPRKEDGREYSHEHFYFNESKWKAKHGLYSQRKYFTRDRDALVAKGFIKIVEHYKYGGRSQKNVYKFHDGWKEWAKSNQK